MEMTGYSIWLDRVDSPACMVKCACASADSRLAGSSLIWYVHTMVRGTRWLSSNWCVCGGVGHVRLN